MRRKDFLIKTQKVPEKRILDIYNMIDIHEAYEIIKISNPEWELSFEDFYDWVVNAHNKGTSIEITEGTSIKLLNKDGSATKYSKAGKEYEIKK
jgi:uncharacterized LabA/DUF88 family protein